MVSINLSYEGQLHCKAVHEPSGKKFTTDAPTDNHGKGESFSPTDLVATALGACYITQMGIIAEQKGMEIKGTKARVEKYMSTDKPRRIAKLSITLDMAAGIPLHWRGLLEAVAKDCPVTKSINPDIEIVLEFNYPD